MARIIRKSGRARKESNFQPTDKRTGGQYPPVSDPYFGVELSGVRLPIRPPVSYYGYPVVCQIVCQAERWKRPRTPPPDTRRLQFEILGGITKHWAIIRKQSKRLPSGSECDHTLGAPPRHVVRSTSLEECTVSNRGREAAGPRRRAPASCNAAAAVPRRISTSQPPAESGVTGFWRYAASLARWAAKCLSPCVAGRRVNP